jgi:hypothetical protein
MTASVDWTKVEALQRTDIGRFTVQPDIEESLRVRARYAALERICPALPAAHQVVGVFGCPVVPVDRRTGSPTAQPLATVEALLTHFEDRPHDHAAVQTGPRNGWSLVALQCSTWQGWMDWLVEHAGVSTERPLGDGRTQVERSLQHYGKPAPLVWTTAPVAVFDFGVQVGAEADHQDQLLRAYYRAADQGGWLLWAVSGGRLPSFKPRELGHGVEVVGDGRLVPVWAADPDRGYLDLRGWPQLDPDAVAPPWLVSVLGGR